MFENIKQTVKTAATEAVELAEQAYNSGEGQLKKQAAIEYIGAKITLPPLLAFLKPVLLKLLAQVIDDAVETAVLLLKQKLDVGEPA